MQLFAIMNDSLYLSLASILLFLHSIKKVQGNHDITRNKKAIFRFF